MIPQFLLLTLLGLSSEVPNESSTSKVLRAVNPSYGYGYKISAQNHTHPQRSEELRTGDKAVSNLSSDIETKIDHKIYQSIARLSTSNANNGEFTTDFPREEKSDIQKFIAQNKNLTQTEVSTVHPENQTLLFSDSIKRVLNTLFPDGLPPKNNTRKNSALKGGRNMNEGTRIPSSSTTPRTYSLTTEANFYPVTATNKNSSAKYSNNQAEKIRQGYLKYINSNEDVVRLDFDIRNRPGKDSESTEKFVNIVQELISGDDLLKINDAVEEYRTNEIHHQTIIPNLINYVPVIPNVLIQEVQVPEFHEPIIVEDILDDNVIAYSSNFDLNDTYLLPPDNKTENISLPNPTTISPEVFSEDDNNNEIPEERLGKNPDVNVIIQPVNIEDLDRYQEVAEETVFKRYINTEAPSRAFLRKFDEQLARKMEDNGETLFVTPRSNVIDSRLSYFDKQFEHDNDGEIIPNTTPRTVQTTFPIMKPRATLTPRSAKLNSTFEHSISTTTEKTKTFVEIQKSVNIQNLLIKEDGDSIERHEEYLQPLLFGGRYMHKVDSKFMKDHVRNSITSNSVSNLNGGSTRPVESVESKEIAQIHYTRERAKFPEKLPSETPINLKPQQNEVLKSIEYTLPTEQKENYFEESTHTPIKHTTKFGEEYKTAASQVTQVKSVQNSVQNNALIGKEKEFLRDRETGKNVNPNGQIFINVLDPIPYNSSPSNEKHVEVNSQRRPNPQFLHPLSNLNNNGLKNNNYPSYMLREGMKQQNDFHHYQQPIDYLVPPMEPIKIAVQVPIPVHYSIPVPVQVPFPVLFNVPYQKTIVSSQQANLSHHQQHYHHQQQQQQQQQQTNLNFNTHNGENEYRLVLNGNIPLYHDTISDQSFSVSNSMPYQQHHHNHHQLQLNNIDSGDALRYPKKYNHLKASPNELRTATAAAITATSNNVQNDYYYGPVPLPSEKSHWLTTGNVQHKRSPNFARNLKMEYGFKPPLIPSIEIDDQGLPIKKDNNDR